MGNPNSPNSLLDFVAIATASDIVPFTDENRILVKEGFLLINTNPRPSLKTLIESSGLKIGAIILLILSFSCSADQCSGKAWRCKESG